MDKELTAENAKEMYQYFHWSLRRYDNHALSASAVLYFINDFDDELVIKALSCAQKVFARKKQGEYRIITTAQRLHFRRVALNKKVPHEV